MRQVVLDTETTGLEVERGHRVIEIGCVEMVGRRRTARTFHRFVNPDRAIDEAAEEVHGISREMLADKPKFVEVVAEFLDFIDGAELIIHNADFDVGFLNNELKLAGVEVALQERCEVLDTLTLARQMHPGQRNSLDALCRRYHIDNSGRDLHGALLDAQLLADVYLAMTGGQVSLSLDDANVASEAHRAAGQIDRTGLNIVIRRASQDEVDAHEQYLNMIETVSAAPALWRRINA